MKSVSQFGCVSQDSDALASQGRKSRRSPMQEVVEPIQKVYDSLSLRYVTREPREKKGPSLGKITCQSSSSAKFQRFEIWGLVPWLDWKTERCARSKAWNLAKNIYELKEKTRLLSTFPRRNGHSRLRQQNSRKRVCGGFKCEYAHGELKRP